MAEETTVYTDGACLGNPDGPGGWAWAVPDGPYASGAEASSTNQRMEIRAALEAALALAGRLYIRSDSTYVVNCWRDRWWEKWLRNGWRNAAKQPVANQDLWKPLVDIFQEGRLRLEWVKGHSGDPFNDQVDRLAVEAAKTQQGRRGVGRPSDLGPADEPSSSGRRGGGAGRDPRLPAGRLLVVTGHRPPELGGYDPNPIAVDVRRRLGEILAAKAELNPDLVVLTGLGLGAEQLGAEAAVDAGVPYVAVLAYPDPDSVWPEAARRRFRSLVDGAQASVVLDAKAPDSKQKAGAALSRRDAWLARNAAEAVVVWDERDPVVGRQVRSLRDHLGEEEVWVVEPQS